ncbi:MAG: dockerin type I repeat-containing protein [Fidelibacterota bacterium]
MRNIYISILIAISTSQLLMQDVSLEIQDINYLDNSFIVEITNSVPIYSFQLTIEGVTISDVVFFQDPWFWMLYSFSEESGFILAYTFDTPPTPPGQHNFLQIFFDETPDTEICITDFAFSYTYNGDGMIQDIACCEYLDLPPFQIPGDANFDNELDVLDIILIVNFVLGGDQPSSYELYSFDVNNDEAVDVIDIVELVGIIVNGI